MGAVSDLLATSLMPRPGDIDLCTGFEADAMRLAAEVIFVLLALRRTEPPQSAAFARVHVGVHADHDTAAVLPAVAECVAANIEEIDTSSMHQAIEQRTVVTSIDAGSHDSLLAWWSAVPPDDAAIVIGIERFLLPDEAVERAPHASVVTAFDDTLRIFGFEQVWGPRVAMLAKRMRLRSCRPYTACITTAGVLADPSVRASTLEAFDGAVTTFTESLVDALARLPEWVRELQTDRDVESVAAEIRSATQAEWSAAQILVQALLGAGRFHEAWVHLEPHVDEWREGSPSFALVLATIALHAERTAVARDLLQSNADALPSDPTPLLQAFDLAAKLDEEAVGRKLLQRLEKLAPTHPRVRRLSVLQAIGDERWNDARQLLDDPARIEVDHATRSALEAHVRWQLGVIDDETYLANASESGHADRAYSAVIGRAFAQQRPADALRLLARAPRGRRVARAWCDAFERACHRQLPEAVIDVALHQLVAALAVDPADAALRGRASQLFEYGGPGQIARALALQRVADVTAPTKNPAWPGVPPRARSEALDQYLARLRSHWAGKPLLATLPQRLPDDVVPDDAVEMYWAVYVLLEQAFSELFSPEDGNAIAMLLKAALDLTSAFNTSATDRAHAALDVLELVARGFATHAQYQSARNIAQAALDLAAAEPLPSALRRAWFIHADVYLRCRNPVEGLLGLACSLSVDSPPQRERDTTNELIVCVRCLRDHGVLEPALALAREHLSLVSGRHPLQNRARYLCLTIEMEAMDLGEFTSLADAFGRSTELLESVVEDGSDEVMPAVSLHVQLLRHCRQRGLRVPDGAGELIERALRYIPPHAAARVRALASDTPTAEALFAQVQRLYEETAYVEDLASDRFELAILARRIVGTTADPTLALRIIEILVDVSFRSDDERDPAADRVAHGYRKLVLLREGKPLPRATVEAASGPVAPTRTLATRADVERLSATLDRLGAAGVEFHGLALDDDDALVHVVKRPAEDLRLIDSARSFDAAWMQAWSVDYPRAYMPPARDWPAPDEIVRETMGRLQILSRPGTDIDATVFVTSVELSVVPQNLLLREGEFAGALGPVVAAPSLSWLAAQPHGATGSGARQLWVLPARSDGDEALTLAKEIVPHAVKERRIIVHIDAAIDVMQRCELAVVMAHGELGPTHRYFTNLRDGFARHYAAADLVDALRGSGVVVLLVCNGGRVEQVPHGLATTGLPRMLLDAGVRTVVASPWALDVYVACGWLDPFLSECEEGSSIARGAHVANLAVRDAFEAPTHWLAMHVFGDPTTSLSRDDPADGGE